MKKLFFLLTVFCFFGFFVSAQTSTLKRVVSLEQAVKTATNGWQKMYVQENDSTLHVYRVKSDGQKAKIQDLGTLYTNKGDAWKGAGFPGPLFTEEKKESLLGQQVMEPTSLPGYDPNGKFGFKYEGKDVRFSTLKDMESAKNILDVHYMDKKTTSGSGSGSFFYIDPSTQKELYFETVDLAFADQKAKGIRSRIQKK